MSQYNQNSSWTFLSLALKSDSPLEPAFLYIYEDDMGPLLLRSLTILRGDINQGEEDRSHTRQENMLTFTSLVSILSVDHFTVSYI
jgi:hypothetical protein